MTKLRCESASRIYGIVPKLVPTRAAGVIPAEGRRKWVFMPSKQPSYREILGIRVRVNLLGTHKSGLAVQSSRSNGVAQRCETPRRP